MLRFDSPSSTAPRPCTAVHFARNSSHVSNGAQTDRNLAGIAPEVGFISLEIASAANGVVEDVGFEESAMAATDYLIRHPDLGVKLVSLVGLTALASGLLLGRRRRASRH